MPAVLCRQWHRISSLPQHGMNLKLIDVEFSPVIEKEGRKTIHLTLTVKEWHIGHEGLEMLQRS